MDVLIRRLRASQSGSVDLHRGHYRKDCGDAADEIERLRDALENIAVDPRFFGTEPHRIAARALGQLLDRNPS